VRNVDKRPRPDFVKAYMHNGYFKGRRLSEKAIPLSADRRAKPCHGPRPGIQQDRHAKIDTRIASPETFLGGLGMTGMTVKKAKPLPKFRRISMPWTNGSFR
jgi:hypothetical protein